MKKPKLINLKSPSRKQVSLFEEVTHLKDPYKSTCFLMNEINPHAKWCSHMGIQPMTKIKDDAVSYLYFAKTSYGYGIDEQVVFSDEWNFCPDCGIKKPNLKVKKYILPKDWLRK